jgi:hypothetical protein
MDRGPFRPWPSAVGEEDLSRPSGELPAGRRGGSGSLQPGRQIISEEMKQEEEGAGSGVSLPQAPASREC